VIVVVATTPDGVARVEGRLARHGVRVARVAAPADARRLVLVALDDDGQAAQLAAALRTEGELAVARPGGGPRLDAWVDHTRPITIGDRLSLCFAWSEHDRRRLPGLLELGPGGFGSGQHPSTRMVVEELLDLVRGGERVLDVGCGSGVLGLAALALGAAHVVALDIDVDAVEATRRNADLNAMGGLMNAMAAPLGEIGGRFDLVLANIGRAGLVELAPQLVERVDPGGHLVASGISPSQGELVAGYLRPLVEVARRTSGEWATVVLARRTVSRRRRRSWRPPGGRSGCA
jgi:2-polyprenyl-3-methyl-5-hydroxy-6-metoxy-1,4-benzoquinol methylase